MNPEFPQFKKLKLSLIQDSQVENATSETEVRAIIEAHLKEFPKLFFILNKFIDDKDHPVNIIANLRNPEVRQKTLKLLIELASSTDTNVTMSEDAYRKFIDNKSAVLGIFFKDDDSEFFNVTEIQGNKRKRIDVLREKLLTQNPSLYSIINIASQKQWLLLEQYVAFLHEEVLPKLREKIEEVISPIRNLATTSVRVKTAKGMIDKIQRMREGKHYMGTPKPEYAMADMQDALGGKITVHSLEILPSIIARLQEIFGPDNIYRKENLYTSSKKKYHTYKAIKYTVLFMGIPCEIQIETLLLSLANDIYHNVAYKPDILPDLDDKTRDYSIVLRQQAVISEIQEVYSITSLL
ncbi:MAG: hypothetical protein AAB815_01180 [Patescibacteria group bacterium]